MIRYGTVVVVGGEGVDPVLPTGIGTGETTVIAADSGVGLAHDLGLTVDHVVGDLDSVDLQGLRRAISSGAVLHRHPADKDATDSELALDLARHLAMTEPHRGQVGPAGAGRNRSPDRLIVLGRGAGRLDHLVADLLMLATAPLEDFEVTAAFGPATVSVLRPGPPLILTGRPGEQVSLIPVSAPARGVSTTGLRWPLDDADLALGTTRGVSNEFATARAQISMVTGTALVIQPGTVAAPIAERSSTYDPSPRTDDGHRRPTPPDFRR